MGYGFRIFDCDEDSLEPVEPLWLEIDDLGKAITTFEIDIIGCRMAMEMIASRLRLRPDEVSIDLESGRVDASSVDASIRDSVFDDCLDFCEYILNRITPHSDKAIRSLMIHARFSMAYILCIDPSESIHSRTRKGRTKNLAAFSHTNNIGDEFREISHYYYDIRSLTGVHLDIYSCCETIRILDIEYRCARYYRTILSEVSGRRPSLMVQLPPESPIVRGGSAIRTHGGDRYLPLLHLVSELDGMCERIPPLMFHDRRDTADMRNDRVCEDEAMLGRVRVRKPDLESSPSSISTAYGNNRGIATGLMRFARLVECIMSGSVVEGRRITLSFRNESLLRMLDPDLFGKRYVTPTVVFAGCDGFREMYEKMLSGFEHGSNRYEIKSGASNTAGCIWKYSGRQNVAFRTNGIMCIVLPPMSRSTDSLLTPIPRTGEETNWYSPSMLVSRKDTMSPVILVSDPKGVFELESGLGDPARSVHAEWVRMIVEVDADFSGHTPMMTRNRDSNEIPLVVISEPGELFDLQTEGVLPRCRNAANRILNELEQLRLNDAKTLAAVEMLKECCRTALKDVETAKETIVGRHS